MDVHTRLERDDDALRGGLKGNKWDWMAFLSHAIWAEITGESDFVWVEAAIHLIERPAFAHWKTCNRFPMEDERGL